MVRGFVHVEGNGIDENTYKILEETDNTEYLIVNDKIILTKIEMGCRFDPCISKMGSSVQGLWIR